jgi:hypothetical protein
MQSDGVSHTTLVETEDIENYKEKSEFELVTEIEEFRHENGNNCSFCGSDNVEVYDVSINGNRVFSLSEILSENEFIMAIKIEKENKEWKFSNKGSNYKDAYSALFALNTLKESILNEDEQYFNEKDSGFFSALVSGKPDISNNRGDYVCRIQRLRHVGFDLRELYKILDAWSYRL